MDGPRAVRHLSTHLISAGATALRCQQRWTPPSRLCCSPQPCPTRAQGPLRPVHPAAALSPPWLHLRSSGRAAVTGMRVAGHRQRAPSVRLFLFSAQNAPVTPISTQVPPGSYETLLALPRCRALSARSRWRCSWLGGLALLFPLPGPLAGSLCAGMSLGPSDPAVQCVLCDPAPYTRCGLQKAEEQGRPSRLERGASG